MVSRQLIQQLWGWRRVMRPPRLLMSVILLGALAAGGTLALRALRPAAPAQILPGQSLAWDIARAAARSDQVQHATGAYLPGDRIVLYTRTAQTDRARIRTWSLVQLEAFADRLAKMPAGEKLTWVIDFGPPPGEQEVLTAPIRRAADPASYRYVSSAPGLLADHGAPAAEAPTADAPAEPTAAPAADAPAEPTAAPVQPTTAPAADTPAQPAAISAEEQPLLTTSFDETGDAPSPWLPLSGDWALGNGIYSQRDASGYDFISMLDVAPQTHYRLEAQLRLGEGEMGGGFIYNAPDKTVRAGAQTVDFDKQGSVLRWGRYNDKGTYVYQGSVKVDPPINDGQWHTLQLITHAGTSVVSLDGRALGTITNTSAHGYFGLTTSVTKVDFDSVQVAVLPASAGDQPAAAPAPQPTAAPLTRFTDDFADGDTQGWQVLSGTWQNRDGVYQQTDLGSSDLGSVTPFQSEGFTATVRLRRLDGDMGGGLYFNMAKRDSKSRSQMINYTQGGKALQWGHFDEGGNFVFEGSAPVPDGNDGEWHTLGVRVAGGTATFTLDGKVIAEDVTLTYTSGYVGLLASHSKVAFDDVTIAAQ